MSEPEQLKVVTDSAQATEMLGQRLARFLHPADVIAFYGDLGAGKTTFVLMHIYQGRLPIYHFDAYRLKNAGDLYNIGAEDYIGTDGVACLEWSERVEEMLPADCLRVKIYYHTALGPNGRELIFEASQGRGLEIVEALKKQNDTGEN